MEIKTNFIVVDDDDINNIICYSAIESIAPNADIQTFNIPEEGFAYVSKQYPTSDKITVLFLDINMPSLSGWGFLDQFEKLEENIKKQFQVHMLSSSLDPNDKRRALANKNVIGFIEKPLTKAILQKMFY
ncbi:MAG: response regulator [Bacteroidota bacterium]